MAQYKTLLFDLDGTLTDPRVGLTRAVQQALARMGIAVDDPDSLTPFIGPPFQESFARYYGFDAAQIEQATTYYREYYWVTGMYENVVYPGIPALLAKLRRRNVDLHVATSKVTETAEQILRHFDLRHYFDGVFGSNLDNSRATKTEVVAYALSQMRNGKGGPIAMIGDRMHDVVGARNNAVDALAVTYGYGSLQELEAAAPDRIVHSVDELSAFLLDGH